MALAGFEPTDGTVPQFGGLHAFPNSVRDAPTDPTVPSMIEDTRGLVEQFLELNHTFALDAITNANDAIAALSMAVVPPDLPDPPAEPHIITNFSAAAGLGFDAAVALGDIIPTSEDPFVPDDVSIPDITTDLPIYTSLGLSINIPDSPTLDDVPAPVEPGLDLDLVIPDAPAQDYGGSPDLDDISLPVYVAPTLPLFGDEAPEFDTLPPDPFLGWVEPEYTSDMRDAVQSVLLEMLAGGTGLPEDVERAIWERGRTREDANALKTIDIGYTEFSARGFDHPQGQLEKLIFSVIDDSNLKINALSRDVMIKQAELEQANRNFAVEKGLSYEQIYVGIFLAIVERNFQIAKFGVETQIQVFNSAVMAFNAERDVYNLKIAKYRIDLDATLVSLKHFEALVEVEKAKAEINTSKVEAYKARVQAYSAQVDAYKAVVQAVTAKADLQKNKVDIYRAQIDAMVAKINAQRSKFEAYDSRIKGETSKVQLEDANVRVYTSQVQAWSEKANVLIKEADLGLQTNRQKLDWNIANMQRVTSYNGQLLNVIQARLSSFQANVARSVAKYNADSEAYRFNLQSQVSLGQLGIAKYQALLEQWKVRAQEIIQYGTVQAESLRAAGVMASNMVSGALAGTHVSAGLSAGTSAAQNSSRSSSDSTNNNKSISDNASYSVVHNYAHRA